MGSFHGRRKCRVEDEELCPSTRLIRSSCTNARLENHGPRKAGETRDCFVALARHRLHRGFPIYSIVALGIIP